MSSRPVPFLRLAISRALFATVAAALLCSPAIASGILMDGAGARSQALGGAGVTGLESGLEALAANPAALSEIQRPTLELGGELGWIKGDFSNRANSDAKMTTFGAAPAGALTASWGPLAFGLGIITDAAMKAEWNYRDTPGGLTGITSYGERTQLSQIGLLRTAFGMSYAITPQLSFGAGVGLLYNNNRLKAPYIIQSQPQLAGAKTLLDMETDGWGWNGQFGLLWAPRKEFSMGLSYTLPSRLRTTGDATSDAGQQLADLGLKGVDAKTHFDAEVTNNFPQTISAGAAWHPLPRLELVAQLDWINWADSFDNLDVRLRHTNSALYRTLLAGSSELDDTVPLDWRDQLVPRVGAEYMLTDRLAARVGYRYGRSPVPSDTLTPLTAAIPEHVVTAGFGYRVGRFTGDLSYQWHVPQSEHIGQSRLLSGEYTDSDIKVSTHSVALTLGVAF